MTDEQYSVLGDTFQVNFIWGKRRRFPRYSLPGEVEYVVSGMGDEETTHALARDISLGGVGVLAPDTGQSLPRVGAKVRLRLEVEELGDYLSVEGEVVHADPEQGFGVMFSNLTGDARKWVKQMLTMRASVSDEV